MQKPPRALIMISLAMVTASAMSTGISSASPVPQSENLDSLGIAQSSADLSANLEAEVHQAKRDKSSSFLSITWSIENTGNSQEGLAWLKDGSYIYAGQNFAAVTILNSEERTRYHPIMDDEGSCLCSGESSNEFIGTLNPGEKIAYWSLFSVPDDIDSVTVEIPNFDPIEDIPIS